MRRVLIFFLLFLLWTTEVQALKVSHDIQVSIGFFDAAEAQFSYAFYKGRDYDVKTALKTANTFGALYPFQAAYHAVGTYNGALFKPQDYFYETQSRSHRRSKEIFYKDGVPQYRVSKKDTRVRRDNITPDSRYGSSADLLSLFGAVARHINEEGDCDFEQYSFNGKKYAKSTIKTEGKEKIKTPYFEGKALKCRYMLEVMDDADAGFLLNKDEPVYFWVLQDKETKVRFLAKALIKSTPFGRLQALTTKIEVKK